MRLNQLFHKRFYEKVVTIAKNTCMIIEKEPSLDTNIQNIHINAVECFFQKQYLATIFLASIGVETYLNKTLREKNWIYLNSKSIKKAYEAGIIAVTELLDKSEKTVLKKGEPKPIFCARRNKILHGDTGGLFKIKGPEIENVKVARPPRATYVGMKTEETIDAFVVNYLACAYDQLLKAIPIISEDIKSKLYHPPIVIKADVSSEALAEIMVKVREYYQIVFDEATTGVAPSRVEDKR